MYTSFNNFEIVYVNHVVCFVVVTWSASKLPFG